MFLLLKLGSNLFQSNNINHVFYQIMVRYFKPLVYKEKGGVEKVKLKDFVVFAGFQIINLTFLKVLIKKEDG